MEFFNFVKAQNKYKVEQNIAAYDGSRSLKNAVNYYKYSTSSISYSFNHVR